MKDYSNHFDIISPCKSEFNKKLMEKNVGNEEKFSKWALRSNSALLIPKDRRYVKISDIIIVNMNIYSPERPFIGTIYELAWAYDSPEKMVVGIFDGDPRKDFQCNHPFVRETIHTWAKNEIGACNIILEYIDV
jgi:nucleoside 2-deoxyribosyltransferase